MSDRVFTKFLVPVVLLLAVVAFASACALNASDTGPDAQMTRYFQEHRAQFMQLLGILQAEPRIVYMSRMWDEEKGQYTWIKIADVSGQQVSGPRAQQVLDLWRKLNLGFISYSDGEFMMEGMSGPDDGPFKAFVYATSTPSPLVQDETGDVADDHSVYRALGDGWYILYGQRG